MRILTYRHVVDDLDQATCRDTRREPTQVDRDIIVLREEFLRRVSKGIGMRFGSKAHRRGDAEVMIDILRDGNLVFRAESLPFGDRKVPEVHMQWLREEIHKRGLGDVLKPVFEYEDFRRTGMSA